MKREFRTAWGLVGLSLIVALAALYFLGADRSVAIHWNTAGVADGHARAWVAFMIAPMVQAVLLVLLGGTHLPKPRRTWASDVVASRIGFTLSAVLLMLELLMVASALGVLDRGFHVRVGAVGLGLVLTVVGNYMPKLQPNHFAGIRTPWTLADPGVWRKTHRLGAPLFMLTGLAVMMSAVTLPATQVWRISLVLVIPMALISIGYSAWVAHQKKN